MFRFPFFFLFRKQDKTPEQIEISILNFIKYRILLVRIILQNLIVFRLTVSKRYLR